MIQGVAVVWMPVEDIERAKGFYRDTLGLPIQKEDGPWAEVDANGLTIGLNGREPGLVEQPGRALQGQCANRGAGGGAKGARQTSRGARATEHMLEC